MKKFSILLNLVLFAAILAGIMSYGVDKVSAVSGANWKPGRIIDDAIFTNKNAISVDQIQAFLNSKVGTGGYDSVPGQCDTNGVRSAQPYTNASRADYAASLGRPTKFTCLNNYYEVPKTDPGPGIPASNYGGAPIPAGARSAAQLIWDAAQRYNISPKVLLVTIQKESAGPLTTDDWPFQKQYTYAMGAHCPDSGPGGAANCDENYAGFSIQISESAALFRYYLDNMSQPWWPYKKLGNNNILYQNAKPECGSSTINITTQATAALYTYTPYQPNQAALDNLYGLGDACSAYGNRNFWRIFNDWFGPTTDDELFFTVMQQPGTPDLYLATRNTKYYINGEAYAAWGLSRFPTQQVTSDYFNSFPTASFNLRRLLKDQWGNYFFVDNQSIHYVRDPKLLSVWGLDPGTAIQSTGLVYALPSGDWLGRFIKDADPSNSQILLMDGGIAHLFPQNSPLLYHWGYVPDQLTRVSSSFITTLTSGSTVTRFVSAGGRDFIVDSGRILYFDDPKVENAYGANTYSAYNLNTLSLQPLEKASVFVKGAVSQNWYMLEGGKKHYIPDMNYATVWGYKNTQPPTVLSDEYLNTIADGGLLSYLVQTPAPITYWALDGTSRYIPNGNVANAWIPQGFTLPVYSYQSLQLLNRGADLSTIIKPIDLPYVYTLDGGKKKFLPIPEVVNAWGSPRKESVTPIGSALSDLIPEAAPISIVIKNATNHYLLVDGTKYRIDPLYLDIWRATDSPLVEQSTLDRFDDGPTIQAFVKINGSYYIMDNLFKIPVSRYGASYQVNDANSVSITKDYFPSLSDASYLIKSSDPSDTRSWLMNGGKKLLLDTFEKKATYGYISRGVPLTVLSPPVISSFPDDNTPASLLITKPGAGVKFLTFGRALSFSDGATLTNFIHTQNPILTVAPAVYDSFNLSGDVSRLIRDDSGKIYYIENGTKRWILNGTLLSSTYKGIPITYLEGTTINLIPNGAPIN